MKKKNGNDPHDNHKRCKIESKMKTTLKKTTQVETTKKKWYEEDMELERNGFWGKRSITEV